MRPRRVASSPLKGDGARGSRGHLLLDSTLRRSSSRAGLALTNKPRAHGPPLEVPAVTPRPSSPAGSVVRVLIGTDSLRSRQGQVRSVSRLITYPGYDPQRNDNDFMLVQLNRPVQFGSNIKKIRLATRCPMAGTRCIVSGWGTTRSPGGTWPPGQGAAWGEARGRGRGAARRAGDLLGWALAGVTPRRERLLGEGVFSWGSPRSGVGLPPPPSPEGGPSIGHLPGNRPREAERGGGLVGVPPHRCLLHPHLVLQPSCPRTCNVPPSRPSAGSGAPRPTATPSPPTCSAPASPRGASTPARYRGGAGWGG